MTRSAPHNERGDVAVLNERMLEVLAAAGLHTIEHYVQVWTASIMRGVEHRPICWLFENAEGRRGTTHCIFWWDQPRDLDATSAGAPAEVAAEGDGGGRPRLVAAGPDYCVLNLAEVNGRTRCKPSD